MQMSPGLPPTPLAKFRNKTETSFSRGFTIVELIVVIVVIAILAAVAVVSYNGISQKAQNSETVANVRQVLSVIQMYVQEHGKPPLLGEVINIPATPQNFPGAIVCLGEGYKNDVCGYPAATFDAFLFDNIPEEPLLCQQLSAYVRCPIGSMSGSGLTVPMVYDGEQFDFSNALYEYFYDPDSPSDWMYTIFYMLRGNVDCGITGAAEYDDQDDGNATTFCYIDTFGGNSQAEWSFD